MVVAISTGCCFDLKLDKLESIHFLEKYASLIDGVELLLGTPKELLEFELDESAKHFLKSLKFVSIHMPFEEIIYKDDAKTKALLDKATELAKLINAKYLVFHPSIVEDFGSLKAPMQICIENMNKKPKNEGYCKVKEIKQILENNPSFGLVLDLGHALGNNINPTDFLELKSKLKSIHVNGQWIKKGNLKEHGFLTEGTSEQLDKVKPLLKLNLPKIIESDFYPEKLLLVEKEIELLKKFELR